MILTKFLLCHHIRKFKKNDCCWVIVNVFGFVSLLEIVVNVDSGANSTVILVSNGRESVVERARSSG